MSENDDHPPRKKYKILDLPIPHRTMMRRMREREEALLTRPNLEQVHDVPQTDVLAAGPSFGLPILLREDLAEGNVNESDTDVASEGDLSGCSVRASSQSKDVSDGEACGDGDHMEETELSHSNGPNSPNTETSEDDAEIGHSEGDNVEANEPSEDVFQGEYLNVGGHVEEEEESLQSSDYNSDNFDLEGLDNLSVNSAELEEASSISEGNSSDEDNEPVQSEQSDEENSSNNSQGEEEQRNQHAAGPLFNEATLHTRIQTMTDISVGECVLMAASLADRHCLTDEAFIDVMELCNNILGRAEVLPSTRHKFKKIFEALYEKATYYVYCQYCGICVGSKKRKEKDSEVICPNELCGKPCKLSLSGGNFFVIPDIEAQLEHLLNGNSTFSDLHRRRQTANYEDDGILRDVCDGNLYKVLFRTLDCKRDFSFNLHVDGAKVFHTSKNSMYPIQFTINELSPRLRFKNILLAGLWYGKGPVMETFLEPFVSETVKLYQEGVLWTLDDGSVVRSKFAPVTVCADSVQRPQLQNHLQFNARFGCSICYHPGHVIEGTRTVLYPYVQPLLERTEEDLKRDMMEAVQIRTDKNGVNGISPLIFLPQFNHVWGYGADYLHTLLIGCFKDIMEYFFDTTGKPYSLTRRHTLKILKTRLTDIKPPDVVSHTPISLSNLGMWKGSDYGAALLWYIVPMLHDIWEDNKYLVHVACLAEATGLLLQSEISEEDLVKAEALLNRFVKNHANLFGDDAMVYNVHLLLHFVKLVRMNGGLHLTSTFPYESNLRYYKQKVTSSKGVPLQIIERVIRNAYVSVLENIVAPCQRVKNFVKECSSSRKKRHAVCLNVEGCLCLGRGTARQLSDEEIELVGAGEAVEYERAINNNIIIASCSYSRSQKRCNSVVKLRTGDIGEIQSVLVIRSPAGIMTCKCIVKIFRKEPMKCGNVTLSHLWTSDFDHPSATLAVSPRDIIEPAIKIKFRRGRYTNFLATLPNTYSFSMN